MSVYGCDGFAPYEVESSDIPVVATSVDYYRGHRQHLRCARIEAGLCTEAGLGGDPGSPTEVPS
jgi:hypothetical protein